MDDVAMADKEESASSATATEVPPNSDEPQPSEEKENDDVAMLSSGNNLDESRESAEEPATNPKESSSENVDKESLSESVDKENSLDNADKESLSESVDKESSSDNVDKDSSLENADESPSKQTEDVETKVADSSTNEASPRLSDAAENEVYNNLNEEMDSTITSEQNEEEEEEEVPNERPPKRTLDVITIDSDSDDSSICHVESYQATASEAKKLRKGYSSSESSSSSSDQDQDQDDEEDDEEAAGSDADSPVIAFEPSPLVDFLEGADKRSRVGLPEFKLNECFAEEGFKAEFLARWSNGEGFRGKNATLHGEPFQICVLDEFLSDASAIDSIVNDMNTLEWFRKIMDLYEFHRTADLKELSWQRSIRSLYDLLSDGVMKWVAEITNTNLTHISASCALYGPGDHLLLHDDLLEDRKIAFIFYMAPWDVSHCSNSKDDGEVDGERKEGWTKSMGGELEFFSTDSSGKPSVAVKSLLPRNNTFAFFKVGSTSFHQVAEVTSFDYPRLTINGWFHGPVDVDDEKSKSEETINVEIFSPNNEVFQSSLTDWITSVYLTPKCQNQITQKFEETSEISLASFFLKAKYNEMLSALQKEDIAWQKTGPMNLRNYETTNVAGLPEVEELKVLRDFVDLLTSKHFINLLQGYTSLPLQSYCKLELQKWSGGNYSVLPMKEEYTVSEVDIIVYLGCPDRLLKGGSITYILPEEADSDAVISIESKNNALNIVYSESGLAKFTKYISKLSFKEGEKFFMAMCSYRTAEVNNQS